MIDVRLRSKHQKHSLVSGVVVINEKTPRYTFVPGSCCYLKPPLGGRGLFYFTNSATATLAISIATAT